MMTTGQTLCAELCRITYDHTAMWYRQHPTLQLRQRTFREAHSLAQEHTLNYMSRARAHDLAYLSVEGLYCHGVPHAAGGQVLPSPCLLRDTSRPITYSFLLFKWIYFLA